MLRQLDSEGSESLHFYRVIRALAVIPVHQELLKEERFNPMQTTRVIESPISTADWLEVMRS